MFYLAKYHLQCIEIDTNFDGYIVVRFCTCLEEGSVYYVDGTIGIQAPVDSGFVVGEYYDTMFNPALFNNSNAIG